MIYLFLCVLQRSKNGRGCPRGRKVLLQVRVRRRFEKGGAWESLHDGFRKVVAQIEKKVRRNCFLETETVGAILKAVCRQGGLADC